MSIIPTTNISMRAVRSVLFEGTRSLWALCHSPKINKWAKNSPLTANGGKWVSPAKYTQPYAATDQWTYQMPTDLNYPARLGDFRSYTNDVIPPVSLLFPEQLWSDIDNMLSIGLQFGTPYIYGIEDVFPNHIVDGKLTLYPCACIHNPDTGMYSWAAGDSIPNLPGSEIGKLDVVTFCLSSVKKGWADPNVVSEFYSLNFDGTQVVSKKLPIKQSDVTPPPTDPTAPVDKREYKFTILSAGYRNGNYADIKHVNTNVAGLYIDIIKFNGDKLDNPSTQDFSYNIFEVELISGKWVKTGAQKTGTLRYGTGDSFKDALCTTVDSNRNTLQTLMIEINYRKDALSTYELKYRTMFPMGFSPQ